MKGGNYKKIYSEGGKKERKEGSIITLMLL